MSVPYVGMILRPNQSPLAIAFTSADGPHKVLDMANRMKIASQLHLTIPEGGEFLVRYAPDLGLVKL